MTESKSRRETGAAEGACVVVPLEVEVDVTENFSRELWTAVDPS
jgi:hypothetical protein